MHLIVATSDAMEQLGQRLAASAPGGIQIHLSGDLGAGKTTLVRGFLRGAGYSGNVKSPTYTLVEPYLLAHRSVFHFDFYRLNDPEELEAIGYRDYMTGDSVCLVEWPEKGGELSGTADVMIKIVIDGDRREVELAAGSLTGKSLISKL